MEKAKAIDADFKAIAAGLQRVNHALEVRLEQTQEALRKILSLSNAKGCITKEIYRIAKEAMR